MNKILSVLMLLILAVSFAACTPATGKKSYLRVKCPSCGHEFEAPAK